MMKNSDKFELCGRKFNKDGKMEILKCANGGRKFLINL